MEQPRRQSGLPPEIRDAIFALPGTPTMQTGFLDTGVPHPALCLPGGTNALPLPMYPEMSKEINSLIRQADTIPPGIHAGADYVTFPGSAISILNQAFHTDLQRLAVKSCQRLRLSTSGVTVRVRQFTIQVPLVGNPATADNSQRLENVPHPKQDLQSLGSMIVQLPCIVEGTPLALSFQGVKTEYPESMKRKEIMYSTHVTAFLNGVVYSPSRVQTGTVLTIWSDLIRSRVLSASPEPANSLDTLIRALQRFDAESENSLWLMAFGLRCKYNEDDLRHGVSGLKDEDEHMWKSMVAAAFSCGVGELDGVLCQNPSKQLGNSIATDEQRNNGDELSEISTKISLDGNPFNANVGRFTSLGTSRFLMSEDEGVVLQSTADFGIVLWPRKARQAILLHCNRPSILLESGLLDNSEKNISNLLSYIENTDVQQNSTWENLQAFMSYCVRHRFPRPFCRALRIASSIGHTPGIDKLIQSAFTELGYLIVAAEVQYFLCPATLSQIRCIADRIKTLQLVSNFLPPAIRCKCFENVMRYFEKASHEYRERQAGEFQLCGYSRTQEEYCKETYATWCSFIPALDNVLSEDFIANDLRLEFISHTREWFIKISKELGVCDQLSIKEALKNTSSNSDLVRELRQEIGALLDQLECPDKKVNELAKRTALVPPSVNMRYSVSSDKITEDIKSFLSSEESCRTFDFKSKTAAISVRSFIQKQLTKKFITEIKSSGANIKLRIEKPYAREKELWLNYHVDVAEMHRLLSLLKARTAGVKLERSRQAGNTEGITMPIPADSSAWHWGPQKKRKA